MFSPIAQSVEQVAVNHPVRGSSPRWGANKEKARQFMLAGFFFIGSIPPSLNTFLSLIFSQIFPSLPCLFFRLLSSLV